MVAVYSGLIVDNLDSGLFVDSSNGLGIDSILNLDVDTSSFSVSPTTPYVVRYVNTSSGDFSSTIEESLLAVNSQLDIFDMGGNSYLQTDKYATFDAVIHQTKSFSPNNFQIVLGDIGTIFNGVVIVTPDSYQLMGSPVYTSKSNILSAIAGNYTTTSFSVATSILNKIKEGRYTRDSANFFNLYINQNTDYSIVLDASSFDLQSFDGMTFDGVFARHSTSTTKYTITCSLLNSKQLKLTIPNEISINTWGKYIFDVSYTIGTTKSTLLNGYIIINEMVS